MFDQILAEYGQLVAAQPGIPAAAATDPSVFGTALLHLRKNAPAPAATGAGLAASHYTVAMQHSTCSGGHSGPCRAELLAQVSKNLTDIRQYLQ
jgi:hypothetical protein